jgi:HSP20 family protein
MNATVLDPRPPITDSPIPDSLAWLFQGQRTPTILDEPAHPAVGDIPSNLLETWESLWLQVFLPGIEVESLQVEALARRVRLHGKRRLPSIESASTVRREIPTGTFSQVYTLPEEVDGNKAEAHYQRGILTIRLPKVACLRPKAVPVEVVD